MSGPTSAHARSDFDAAKAYWNKWLLLQVIAPVLGMISALLPHWKVVAISAPILTFVLMLGASKLRIEADAHFETGDAIRRSDLLRNGLGVEPPSDDLARQLSETVSTNSAETTGPKNSYYNSSLPKGPRRLAHILAESAHFTAALAKVAAKWCATVMWVAGTVVAILAYLVLSLIPKTAQPSGSAVSLLQQNAPGFAVACVTMASFFAIGTFFDLWRNFKALATTAEKTRAHCLGLLAAADIELTHLLPELEHYNCAAARSAPIPTVIWLRHKAKLTANWEQLSATVRP